MSPGSPAGVGAGGFSFIVLCWYAPGGNVRAAQGTAGNSRPGREDDWGALLPRRVSSALPCSFKVGTG